MTADREVTIDLAPGTVAGRVVAAGSRAPIAGADLALSAGGPRPGFPLSVSAATTHSDEGGAFALKASPGTYQLTVEKSGYAPGTVQVEVSGDAPAEVEVTLTPDGGPTSR